jgi:hypothetical protein
MTKELKKAYTSMNKQIRELIEQCTTCYNGGLGTEIEVFDKEKFAELVVRECASRIQNRGAFLRYDTLAKDVLAHFGIK